MPQHDLVLDNGSGAAFRADANNALAALGSSMKGPNAPPAPFAGLMWLDDDTPSASLWTLKIYDGADWIEIGRLNVTTNVFTVAEGSFAPVDIASAATTDIGAAASPNVRITGTTGITSLGTVAAGTRRFVSFAGALTLTHNATSLILPGAANITTAAGDNMVARSLGSGNWVVESYTRASALPVLNSMATARVLGRVTAGSGAIEEIPLGNAAAALSLGINRGTEQATTSGTAIDFTSIPAGVRRITVMFDGVSFAGSDSASIQLGDSGGIETTGYAGNVSIVGGASAGVITSLSSAAGIIYPGTAAADNCSGVVQIVNQSGNKWLITGCVARNGTAQIQQTVATKTLSDVLDRVRFKVDGASSFDAGAINIMWEF